MEMKPILSGGLMLLVLGGIAAFAVVRRRKSR